MGDINTKKREQRRTICEVHREIYRKLNSLKEENLLSDENFQYLTSRIKEAFDSGKKMNNKLRQYKYDYDEGWWAANKLDGGQLED